MKYKCQGNLKMSGDLFDTGEFLATCADENKWTREEWPTCTRGQLEHQC